jgi:curved DNA-binding protein
MSNNHYAIWGVLPTATLEEIRSAYRSRAKQYHPDHFGKNSAPFRSVQEAYDV